MNYVLISYHLKSFVEGRNESGKSKYRLKKNPTNFCWLIGHFFQCSESYCSEYFFKPIDFSIF